MLRCAKGEKTAKGERERERKRGEGRKEKDREERERVKDRLYEINFNSG